MNAGPPDRSSDERLDLLDALIYADAFDCALTTDEVWRYCRVPIALETLSRRLREDPCLRELVLSRDGFHCLADRPELIARRPARIARARRLERRGRRVARILRHVPFVRGLALTGSAAAGDAAEGADVDLIVAVARNRLGTAFLLLAPVSRLLRRRFFCPNYYIVEDRLEMTPSNVYVARELVQARGLAGDTAGLRTRNPWLADVFPNAVLPVEHADGSGRSRVQRVFEAPLRGRVGDRLDARASRVALARLRVHYGSWQEDPPTQVISDFEVGIGLRFHGGKIDSTALERYSARREQVAARLRRLDEQRSAARGV